MNNSRSLRAAFPAAAILALLLTSGCGDVDAAFRAEHPPGFWMPHEDYQVLFELKTGKPLPAREMVTEAELTSVDHAFLATITKLELAYSPNHDAYGDMAQRDLVWLEELPALRELSLDLTDTWQDPDPIIGGGMAFVSSPRQLRLTEDLDLLALERLTIKTNAQQSLAYFRKVPSLRELVFITKAPVNLNLIAHAKALRSVTLLQEDGVNDIGSFGGPDSRDLSLMKDLKQLESLDIGSFYWCDDYSPLLEMRNLRHLTAPVAINWEEFNGLDELDQLTSLHLQHPSSSKIDPDMVTRLRQALPDCEIKLVVKD